MLILICSLCLSCTFDCYFGLSDSIFIVILLALPSFLPFRDFLEGETHESWDRDDCTRHVKGAVIRSWQVKQPACHPNREVIQIRVKSRGKKYYTNQVSQESIWGGSQGKWHETRNRKSLGCLFNQRQEENRGNSSKNSVYGKISNLQREFQWWLQFLEEEAINQMPESVSLTREDRQ